jgi:succinyl-CoA synthetase beta subunit
VNSHTGGRGKGVFKETGLAGGVHITSSPEEIKNLAEKMVSHRIYTK